VSKLFFQTISKGLIMNIEQIIQEYKLDLLELPRHSSIEQHFVIKDADVLQQLFSWARREHYYLCTVVATDERLRVERTFKVYYVLSAPDKNKLVILEYLLPNPNRPVYPSIAKIFPSAQPLEREILDLFGLVTQEDNIFSEGSDWLHSDVYPTKLFPLRRRPLEKILSDLKDSPEPVLQVSMPRLPEGMLILPVGPIHAGIIEAGHFPFHIAGEVVEKLPLRLGYKHRSIEKLFETHYTLEDGWELAEKVSGDSSFAHSLAYCQAIENIANIEIPRGVLYWRAFFLELERIYNHISDTALLAIGLAYEKTAAEIGVLREAVVQINDRLCGNRLLRGLNRPGGIVLPVQNTPLSKTAQLLDVILEEFLEVSKGLIENPECRARMLTTGVLTQDEAQDATGMVQRASGCPTHDFRLKHPWGIYQDASVQALLKATVTPKNEEYPNRKVPIYLQYLGGDAQARLVMRIAEVETSGKLIQYFVKMLLEENIPDTPCIPIKNKLSAQPNMEFGLGYVEGWRGDIIYFVAKGPENTIFRCKVRDPSVFNWHIFPKAVARKLKVELDKPKVESNEYWENIVADFPIINKSFNLSYAGNDL
jgi:Ni,Fe-hydrogenase III large subunit/Ni,Fe-hydrogenase III component G